jgi:hypothetical protein
MLVQIVNKKRFKALAIFMAVNILAQIGFPSVAFALTSGPSQPEAASFEPINTNQMVDLFTGDFTYNISLLNVPGPNGGYPINLAYHAGIGMEQEASWVGLGWNINPGAINRNLRGIPDDFSGDQIEKTVHMKPQRRMTFGVAAPVNVELLGFDALKGVNLSLSSSIYYDNYKGIGQNTGINLSTSVALGSAGAMQGSLGISMDSKEGIGVSPSLSFAGKIKGEAFGFETGLNYNSRQGLQNITFGANIKGFGLVASSDGSSMSYSGSYKKFSAKVGAGTSFSASTYIPTMDMPRGTYSVDFDMKLGIDLFNVETSPINFFVKYSENKITQNTVSFGSYGLLYAQFNSNKTTLGDFNREKDIPIDKNNKNLPIPSATYDVFSITGQGTGGAFRTYRSDIGVFTDPKIETTSGGVGFGVESNILTPPPPAPWYIKTGFNPGLSVIRSYSGKWKNHNNAVTNYYKFKVSNSDDLYEPAYFRALGETVLTEPFAGGDQNNNELPFRFELGKTWDKITSVPKVKNIIETATGSRAQLTEPAVLSKRQTRVQSIEYLTRNDKTNELYTSNSPNDITDYSPATPYNPNKSHHIGEISVVNPDGNRYVYDLPAYNTAQEDVTFSVDNVTNSTDRTRSYVSTGSYPDNSPSNNKGLSNLYSKTATPAYAHSYLLTEVLSADYVDLTNDGPTDDDLGYWVKFNYIKQDNLFKWRAPYETNKGNNIEGKITNDMDDMSGYSYGEKEMVYLESIETKTHTAKFMLSQREDGLGVNNPNGGVNTSDKLLKLDVITLYNKSAPNQPIKSVHFKYDYSLCPGTPNSIASGGGKLTLTHVWFKYYKNTKKGELSPYEFTYGDVNHDGSQIINPPYNINEIDRWGNYQAQGPFKEISTSNYLSPNFNQPYCNQFDDYTDRNADASAWNLTKVVMPSGGALTIDYESDDYAYVQNRKAAQMYRIIGTGKADGILDNNLTRDDQRIYIELDRAVDINELAEYVSGIEQIYFKAYMKLKKPKDFPGNPTAVDYVEGYAKFTNNATNFGLYQPSGGVSSKAWIKVNNVPPHQVIQSTINPIKMAGLRELRYNRDDLVSGQNTGLAAVNSMMSIVTVVPSLIGTVLNSLQMLAGFYNYGIMAGWCDEIEVNSNTYPSYIRLNNTSGKKYGGGCRVKEIKLNDNWDELNNDAIFKSSSYGQSYDYTLEDRITSSGVAEYEPLIGGEENPFRQPVRFSNDRLIIKDNGLMLEEPFNENLFPSANVGYSRVTVRNIEQEHGGTKVKKAVSGIIVNEFYTARDFPVYTNKTGVDYEGYNLSIPIPFIGSYDHHNNGYSQGYSIELNNMHGKPYSVQTYTLPLDPFDPNNPTDPHDPMPGDPGVEPVAATFYHYKTQQPFVRNKPSGNKLSNTVAVLTGDAKVIDNVEIGKYIETYIDMRENKTNIISGDVQINNALNIYWIIVLGVPVPIPIPIPTVIPSISNSHSMFRSVATNKIITRNGILDSQVTTKEGAKTITENIYYDARTGTPLLTTTTNDFDKPIYDYTYAAHWEHEGMRGAYQNVGATVTDYTSSPFVRPGDELIDLNTGFRYWVEENGTLKDKNGIAATPTVPGLFKIARSGYRNQQSVPTGSIISLSNPIAERKFPLFDEINNFTKSVPVSPDYILIGDLGFNDCLNNKPYTGIKITISPANQIVIDSYASDNKICGGGETNEAFILFDPSVDLTTSANFDVTTMILTKHGNEVKAVDGSGKTIWGELLNAECLNECIDGVLHAGATKYSSSWNIDYADAVPNSSLPLNTTRFGAENIWRTHQNFVFDIDRKQTNPAPAPLLISNTQTGIDGTYENFGLFNWLSSAPNEKWIKANQVNQYSPYGFELENQDALNIKSAAMYGYNNSVVTAVASNTDYRELAFDGFEDYIGVYTNPTSPNYGHIKFTGTHSLVTTEAHTGNVSMEITSTNKATFTNPVGTSLLSTSFTPSVNEEYYFSSWVKLGANASATLTLSDGVNPIQILTSSSQQKIEGWQRLEGKFAIDAAATTITIEIEAVGGTIYLDDVRVQPFISNMKTFVYDPATLWLKAELDDRNYATIYSYDEEGSLVQIKKETKDGMRTIVSNRKNVQRNPVGIQP